MRRGDEASHNKNTRKRSLYDIPSVNMGLWVLLDQTRDLVAKARELELRHYNLTRAQAAVLYILLFENKGLTIAEISNWNMREPNSVLSLVNRMEKTGLIQKSSTPHGNKILISVTEAGRKLYNNLSRQSMEMIFSSLSEEEKQQLKSLLVKVRAKSRELLGMDFRPPFLP